MNIRTKLTVFYGSLLTAVVVLASGALYLTERRLLLTELENARHSLFAGFSQTCRDALLVRDELSAINAALSVGKIMGVQGAFCVDPTGRVVAHSDPARRGTRYTAPPTTFVPLKGGGRQGRWVDPTDGELLGFAKEFSIGAKTPAQAVIVFSQRSFQETVTKTLVGVAKRILVVFSLAWAAGLVGTVLLAGRLTRPIFYITAGTHQLAQGNLTHRIDWKGKDELGRLAADFNVMAERLGELDQMKNDFVSNVTHELRSPLSAIESYANLVTDDWRNGRSHNLVDYLTIVRNNATRLRKFVTDILDLSKIDAASVEMEKERFDLGVLFQEVVDLFQAKAREKNIRLGAELPSSVSVFADMDKVRQILTNLLGNALKFTPPGGKVTLSAEPAVRREGAGGRFTRITVADNGPGIPDKDQQRIFDRFEQVKEMRESVEGQKGTGLGLAIVRQLVTAHGGQIGLVSAVGRGSAFSVYLPEGEAHVR